MSKSNFIFNLISPIYRLVFSSQYKHYKRIVEAQKNTFDITSYHSVLDVGCGTGALCSVLYDKNMVVTGVEPAKQMLKVAKKKLKNTDVTLEQGNILEGLSYPDHSFEIVIASFVAHGLKKEERKKMYQEMNRFTKEYVILHDYNEKRSFLTDFIEWLEGGDYFRFIRTVKSELETCLEEMKRCFQDVQVIPVDTRANWYLCKVIKE